MQEKIVKFETLVKQSKQSSAEMINHSVASL